MKKPMKILLGGLVTFAAANALGFALRVQIWQLLLQKKPGNASLYCPENVSQNPNSPLNRKTVIFLGSSVTRGEAALATSFVEYLEWIDGITAVKEAVSGTTLTMGSDTAGTSYIPRMEAIDPGLRADCFVCQLSTNDAAKGKPLGAVSDSFDRVDFDRNTVAGAIEYIISYAQDTWNCPIVFFTRTRYDSGAYGQMVNLLLEIQKKWGIGVIDLWNSEEMNGVSKKDYSLYMADGVHPTRAGYLLWWTPQFESYLIKCLDESQFGSKQQADL